MSQQKYRCTCRSWDAALAEAERTVTECRVLVDDRLTPSAMVQDAARQLAAQIRALKQSGADHRATQSPYDLNGPKEYPGD